MDAKSTKWDVIWKTAAHEYTSGVLLVEGYSNFNDIPNMISLRTGIRVDRIEIKSITRIDFN